MQTTGCTQEPLRLSFDTFNLIDTAGLNDPNMTTSDWSKRLNAWVEKQSVDALKVDLTVVCFKQGPRPSTADANVVAVLKHLVAECNLDNLCIVFTFCDGINPNKRLKPGERLFDREYAAEWFNRHVR